MRSRDKPAHLCDFVQSLFRCHTKDPGDIVQFGTVQLWNPFESNPQSVPGGSHQPKHCVPRGAVFAKLGPCDDGLGGAGAVRELALGKPRSSAGQFEDIGG